MVFQMLSEDMMIIGSRKKLYFWGITKRKLSMPLENTTEAGNI